MAQQLGGDLRTEATPQHLLSREGFTRGAEIVAWTYGWKSKRQ